MRTSELKQPRTISWMTCWQSYRPTRSPNHHIGCESFHSFFTVSRARLGLWMFAAGVWKIRYPCLDFPTRTSCATIRFIADQMSWGGVRHHFMWCVEVENSKIRWLSKWNTTWSFSTSWLSASTLHWHPCCLGGTNIACSSMEIFSSTISSWINFFFSGLSVFRSESYSFRSSIHRSDPIGQKKSHFLVAPSDEVSVTPRK